MKIHLIANAHIDPVWLWEWQEGYSETLHTCEFIAELLNEHPELTFTRSSASSYLWIEECAPDLFKKIKKLVKEKRWIISGPWWEQPDCNIPSGESFVRQSLYGKKYFREKFGIDVKVGYNPDSFGHNGNLPQILKKSGIDFYLFCRPDKTEKKLPQIFWWEGPDGSRVLACRPPTHYLATDEMLESTIRKVAKHFYKDLKNVVCMFGVGNHGGGPTRKSLQIIEGLKKDKNLPTLEYSSLDKFFTSILKQNKHFPVVKDELQYHARGCYTSFSPIKRLNRLAENKILTAEIISTLLWEIKKRKYSGEKIEKAWREILFNQFHDILAGSSTPEAYKDSDRMLGKSIITSERIINEKLWHLSKLINTVKIEGMPVLFFNPTPFYREEVKEVSFQPRYNFTSTSEVDFFNENGERVLSQSINDSNTTLRNYLAKIEIPPFGYRIYWWRPSSEKRKNKNLILKKNYMENQFVSLEVDSKTGGIKNVELKDSNWKIFKNTGAEFLVVDDPGDAWAHNIDSFRKVAGKFKFRKIIKGENGECLISLRCKMKFNNSEIFQEYILYDNLPYIEVRGKINWQEKHKILKLSFPVNIEKSKAYVEMPYYCLERKPDGKENPCHRWIDITGKCKGGEFGVSIINENWYGYDFDGKELRMSVLRSPVFASFKNPKDLNSDTFYDFQSQGISEFKYLILPHKGDFKNINTPKFASFFNQPTEYILPLSSKTELPPLNSFVKVSSENMVVTVLKKAEKGDALILRLYESYGKDTKGSLEIFGKSIKIHLKKFEIKTLKLEKKKGKFQVSEVNFLYG